MRRRKVLESSVVEMRRERENKEHFSSWPHPIYHSASLVITNLNHLSLCKEGTTGTFWYQHLVLTLYTFYKKSCQKVKLAAGTLFGRIHQFNFRHLQSKLCEQQVKLLFLEGQLDSSKVFPLRIQMLI